MVAMRQPQLNTLLKSATNPYSKRSFVTFLRAGIFEKNVKSYTKTASKISLFEIRDLLKKTTCHDFEILETLQNK